MSTMHPPSFLTSRCNKCFGLWFQPQSAQDARESPDGAYSYVIDGPCPMSSLSNVSDLKHDNEEENCSSEGPERDILMEFGKKLLLVAIFIRLKPLGAVSIYKYN